MASISLPKFAIGLDIGGTLCKICYFARKESADDGEDVKAFRLQMEALIASPDSYGETGDRDPHLEIDSAQLGGRLYLVHFETRKMDTFMALIKEANLQWRELTIIGATGGGSRKYADILSKDLRAEFHLCDELQSVVEGINFLLEVEKKELFSVNPETYRTTGEKIFEDKVEDRFPYLLVNIGSGVSILRINADRSLARVGGTSLGGATFFGLCSLITNCKDYSEAMQMAENGNAQNVDLLVGDIYGGAYEEFNLGSDVVAASLGKLCNPEVRAKADPKDVARAILDAVTNNIGSLALLHAKNSGTPTVIFAGNFLRSNRISVARLSYAMQFWSQGKNRALFLQHEGYIGAVGALVETVRHIS